MATQPFDKETIDKVTEAFKNLNTETKKTLSDFDASVAAEKKMLDIAKQLGQEFKTQKDSLDDQLKGRNLQEQLQIKLKNSESELSTLSQSRINSQIKINDLQAELKNLVNEFGDEMQKGSNLDSEKLKNLTKIIKSKVTNARPPNISMSTLTWLVPLVLKVWLYFASIPPFSPARRIKSAAFSNSFSRILASFSGILDRNFSSNSRPSSALKGSSCDQFSLASKPSP
jgi:hypothetical protein